jgi:hypothetical protein
MRASFRYAFPLLAAPLLQPASGCDSDLSQRSRVACVSTTNG